jgi:outer membrane protein assembly factor BamB
MNQLVWRTTLFCIGLAIGSPALYGAGNSTDWPRWRGPDDNGSTSRGTYPQKWDATNVLWKATLPGKGCSTPTIWARHIFLTAPVQGEDAALAFDWGGQVLWQTTLGTQREGKRGNSSGCNPSPATDGHSVFVYFKSGELASLDFAGKVVWQTNLVTAFGPETLFWDQGTSPVLTRDAVIIARMNHGDSWLAAFDKSNGRLRWKVPRNFQTAVEGDNSYTTPLVLEQGGKELILVWGGEHVTVHTAEQGQLVWSCGDFNPKQVDYWPTVASPVVVGDMAIIACGRADRGQPRFYCIKLGGAGDVTETNHVWKREDTGTFVPTPVAYQGRLFLVRDHGEIECLEPATGKTLWRDALPKDKASFYSSPVIAGGKLYAAREDGVVFVAAVNDKFELLAENHLGEQVIASPVPVENRLFIRGDHHLFCIE